MTQFNKKIFRHHSGEQDDFIVISDVKQLEQVITEGLQLVPLNLFDRFYCGIPSNRLNRNPSVERILEFLETLTGHSQDQLCKF